MKFKEKFPAILLDAYVIALGVVNFYLWNKQYPRTTFNDSMVFLPIFLVLFALQPVKYEINQLITILIKWGCVLMLTLMLILILVL
jgi:hypothetical protein